MFAYLHIYMFTYLHCNGDPPWKATTCNMFWYNDFGCWFIDFPFVGISLDFSSGALWQNVLPQDFAANSFVRISSEFRPRFRCFNSNLTKFERWFWRNLNEILTIFLTIFFVAKCCGKTFCHKAKFRQNPRLLSLHPNLHVYHFYCKSWASPLQYLHVYTITKNILTFTHTYKIY